ncbi:MAG: hypothetical protein R3C39_01245 [Dehalococcoidia bacterium]
MRRAIERLRPYGAPLVALCFTAAVVAFALVATRDEPPPPEYRDLFSLRRGECFTREHLDSPLWAVVEVVSCDSDRWSFGFLSWFKVDIDGDYPAEDFFIDEAWRRCESGWTTFVYPSEDSWRLGDRAVRCLFEPGSVPPSALRGTVHGL